MAADFVPGLELARRFYDDAVRPVLDAVAPGLVHSAARLGSGSEVLGLDTPRSVDHEWGPRLQLFLSPSDLDKRGTEIDRALGERLPKTFLGWPTHFEPADADIRRMALTDGPVRHRVDVTTVAWFSHERLGFDPTGRRGGDIDLLDWLSTPWQRLAEMTAGAVFHDGLAMLRPLRQELAWFPDDVWRYVLACQWQRIAEEEAFPGRGEEVGDGLGGRVELARLARDLMRLALLMDRRYPPYPKWLGSAFRDSPSGRLTGSSLYEALSAPTWPQREAALAVVYRALVVRHNQLGLTEPVDESPRFYYERPFTVIGAERIADALRATLAGTRCATLPRAGSVDQMADSTAVLGDAPGRRALTRAVSGA